MKLFQKKDRVGDAQIAILEGDGGRAIIAGDKEATQETLMQVVRGEFGRSEMHDKKFITTCRAIGDLIVRTISRAL